ncbi:MAG: hypothetical protein K2X27_13580 [Candidatus Obscuribacterales bacterium]|nr:hypothetical protein [Candidatus Obscuribacterales bacterium]
MKEAIHSRKLAEILIDLEVLSQDELAEAAGIAAQINLPLGRALILSNKLKEDDLRTVLQIQALLRESAVDINSGRALFRSVRTENISLSKALQNAGLSNFERQIGLEKSRLATLLLDAGLLSQEQVDESLKLAYETGTPVGKMLVSSGVLEHSVLARALEIQVLLRENKMTYGQALDLLKAESLRVLPLDKTAEQRGLSKHDSHKRVRLGELLMLSGILTEGDMLNVLELGLTAPKPLGDILMELGLITTPVLQAALGLQKRICNGDFDIRTAAAALQEMVTTGSLPELSEIEAASPEDLRLGDLLKQSGLVDNDDIQEAINLSSSYPAMIGKMLVVAGSIDEGTLLAALRCQFLVKAKTISADEAKEALRYAQRHRLSLDDALEELGILTQSTAKPKS